MKKVNFLSYFVVLALVFSACNKEVRDQFVDEDFGGGAKSTLSTIKWNGDADKKVAVNIDYVNNDTRKNASGHKITSNAHSADFPGIYFIWDWKQKDPGYVKVAAELFEKYSSITLTTKESNKYFDFTLALQDGQKKTADNCYVFFIPKVNCKNINMVFITFVDDKQPVEINLGFIGYYVFEGKVMSTSFYWQKLMKGDCIDWVAVDAAYAGWVAKGGLEPDRTYWQTSGSGSYTFDDYAVKCYGDFTPDQLENYYLAYYVDPGYVMPKEYVFYVFTYDPWYMAAGKWTVNLGDKVDWDAVYDAYANFPNVMGPNTEHSTKVTRDNVIGWKYAHTVMTDDQFVGPTPNVTFREEMFLFFDNGVNPGEYQFQLLPVLKEVDPCDEICECGNSVCDCKCPITPPERVVVVTPVGHWENCYENADGNHTVNWKVIVTVDGVPEEFSGKVNANGNSGIKVDNEYFYIEVYKSHCVRIISKY